MSMEPTPPLKQRLLTVLTSKGRLRESIRWRLEVMGGKIYRFFRRNFRPAYLWFGRRSAKKQTIATLQNRLKEQEKSSNIQAAGLRNRIETLTEEHTSLQEEARKARQKQLVETNNVRKELNALKNLTKGDAVEQLKVSEKLLKTRAERIAKYEGHLDALTDFADKEMRKDLNVFSINGFITGALAKGYHQQGRFFLLDELGAKDWQNLLAYFESKDDGFEALEELRPLFAPWIQYYHGLIDTIQDRGFTVRPLEHYIDNGISEKTVYMYHDVHAWDIIPALGMLLANKDRGICTTFCLNIDQAYVDIDHEAGYRIFGTLVGKNAELGLHCNPFASWVRMDLFGADEEAFMKWFKSDASSSDLKAFVDDKKADSGIFKTFSRATAKKAVLERLNVNFAKLKSFHPEARAANHHGDIVNQLYGKLGIVQNKANSFLFVTALLREKLADSIGIEVSPTAIRRKHKPSATIYSEIQNKNTYYENLHEELGLGLTKQLINHPGAISNGGLVMNLDFVKKLGTGQFEKYMPFKRSAIKPIVKPKIIFGDMDEGE